MWLALALACAREQAPTWHTDISPGMQRHCTRCHNPEGQGPGSFTEYNATVALSESILYNLDSGHMPPPVADPTCADYEGSEHLTVDPALAGLVRDWIAAGHPEGDAALAPEVEPVTEALADPDLELRIPAPYTPTFQDPREPGNEYRCFVLDFQAEETLYIQALAPALDQRALVHHMLLFTVQEEDLPNHDPLSGWDCIDDAFVGSGDVDKLLAGNGMIAGWGPGAVPVEFTDDVGLRITPDQRLVLQLHYFQSAGNEGLSDQSGYAFRLSPEPLDPLLMAPMGAFGFQIPAGDPAYTYTDGFTLPVDLTVHAVFPHMHVLGRAYALTATKDGVETCLTRGTYDFHNQLTYVYRDPVEVEADSTLTMSCTWDNSSDNPDQLNDPPEDVRYGERTDQEMCFAFSLVSLGI